MHYSNSLLNKSIWHDLGLNLLCILLNLDFNIWNIISEHPFKCLKHEEYRFLLNIKRDL